MVLDFCCLLQRSTPARRLPLLLMQLRCILECIAKVQKIFETTKYFGKKFRYFSNFFFALPAAPFLVMKPSVSRNETRRFS